MNKINIEYLFSAGYRCYSPDIMKDNNIREYSGPFDYLFIDLETVFELTSTKMEKFLTNIEPFLQNSSNTYIHPDLQYLKSQGGVHYMAHSYNNTLLRINTNYIDTSGSNNIYEWKRQCIFHHHDIFNSNIYATLNRRKHRYNTIVEKYSDTTCLFHVTRIEHITDISEYMNSIYRLRQKYNIQFYLIIIVCCDNLPNSVYFNNKTLFIIKKVNPYSIQIISGDGTDNCNTSFTDEINVIKNYIDFNLKKINELE